MIAAVAAPTDQAEKAASCLSYVKAVFKLLKHWQWPPQHCQSHKTRGSHTLVAYEGLQKN